MLLRALRLPCTRAQIISRTFPTAVSQFRSYSTAQPAELKKTPLHDLHVASGAKMAPFAGYSMPVIYADQSHTESHTHVRTKAGLFDVSHMLQHRFKGPAALEFLHRLTPSDLTQLAPHQSTLSVLLHPVTGGIVDDLMITMISPEDFYVVTNAGCADKDLAYFSDNLAEFPNASGVDHQVLTGQGLVALQGPHARSVLEGYLLVAGAEALELDKFLFGTTMFVDTRVHGKLHIARGGYTGEDGFEISMPGEQAEPVTRALLALPDTKLAGLGARDSLRLEAGMCLYGHDLDDSTTPIEAGLKWLVGKRRIMEGGFHGHETIARQYADWGSVPRRRIGLAIEKGAPVREGAPITDAATDEPLGTVTSGCPSPTLSMNIAMGYVKSGFHKTGTKLAVKVRGKQRSATVVKMPWVKPNYWKG